MLYSRRFCFTFPQMTASGKLVYFYLAILSLLGKLDAQDCMGCVIDGLEGSCTGLQLVSVPTCLPQNLTFLNLWENNIILESSSFDHLPNLEVLFLQSNGISSVPEDLFRNQLNLRRVTFYANYLTNIPLNFFANNPRIEFIDVTNNDLTGFDVIFAESNLNTVHFFANVIETLPYTVPINRNIKSFDISYNKIKTLDKALFANTQNSDIWLQNNEWHCDCALTELLEVFRQQNISLPLDPACTTPPELAGSLWSSLSDLCVVTTQVPL